MEQSAEGHQSTSGKLHNCSSVKNSPACCRGPWVVKKFRKKCYDGMKMYFYCPFSIGRVSSQFYLVAVGGEGIVGVERGGVAFIFHSVATKGLYESLLNGMC